jgi:ATP/maltotriose-dependent transcriptional regulator MalT
LGNQYGLSGSLIGLGGEGGLGIFALTVEGSRPPDEVISKVAEAVEIAHRIGWRSGEAFSLSMMGVMVSMKGEYGQSFDLCTRAKQIAYEIQHHQWMVLTSFFKANLYLDLGDVARGQQILEPTLELARNLNSAYWMRMIASSLAYAHIAQHNWHEAETVLNAVLSPSTPARTFSERTAWYMRTELLLACGKLDEAMQCLDLLARDSQELDSAGENSVFSIALMRGRVLTELIRLGQDKSPETTTRAETALKAARALAEPWPKLPRLWRATTALAHFYEVISRPEDAARERAATHAAVDAILKLSPHETHAAFLQSVEEYMRK